MTTITSALPPVATPRIDTAPLNPVAVATKIVADHGGVRKPDLSAIQRELDAIKLQDADLGARVRAEVKLLIPAYATRLDTATYTVAGVTISPIAKTVAEQFAAPRGSADHKTYASLDRMFGDGNWRTNDVLRINEAIRDATISGLSLDALVAKNKAADAGWTATVGDFIASVSLGGRLAELARPALASVARDAGLGTTEWGASLQRVLDKPGAMMAFHAGAAQGFVEGGKDFVVTVASLAGRAIQHGADTGIMGLVGDAARGIVPDQVKGWLRDNGAGDVLNAALPSHARGAAANAAMAKTAGNIGEYFATRTPEQITGDVKAKIGGMWESIKADHAAAVAKGPEAESRWWGRVAGRATFEVASTFVPVAGVVGKAGKGAKAVDVVVDGLNAVDKASDAIRIADRTTDAVNAADKAGDAAKAAGTTVDAAAVTRAGLTIEEMAATMRAAVATEMTALRAAGKTQLGPAISVVMDRTTGATSRVYVNSAQGALPDALNVVLRERMPGAKSIDYIKTHGAGTHSEVYAANELLNRGSKLENLVVYTERTKGPLKGQVFPPCPHCDHLLNGVTYAK